MKIDSNLPNPWLEAMSPSKTDGPTPTSKRTVEDKQSATAFPSDSVELTNAAPDEIRADKVAALQRAVATGAYQVSAEDLADAILRDWRG